MSYRDMTWIACFVASEHLNKYGKETVRDMIEKTSYDSVWDFFDAYQRTFDIDMREQFGYCDEIMVEE